MSSSKNDWYLSFCRSTLHPSIALLVPFLFLVSITGILNTVSGGQIRLSMIFYVVLFLTGLEETLVGNILFKENVGGIERLREIVYLLLLGGLILFLLQPGPVESRWQSMGQWQSVYMGLCIVLQWLITFRVHANLRDREILLSFLQDKRGLELRLALRGSSGMANETLLSIRKVKRTIILCQVFVFMLLVLLFFLGVETATPLFVILLLHGMSGVLFVFILNNATQDQLLFGEGIYADEVFQKKRFLYAFVVLSIVIVIVFLLARQVSLLPLSLFQPLLDWLARLFAGRGRPAPRLPGNTPVMRDQRMAETLAPLNEEPSPLMVLIRMILSILGRAVIIGLGLLFIYFLLSPLLSDYFRKRLTGLRPLQALFSKLLAFFDFMARIIAQFIAWLRQPFGASFPYPRPEPGTEDESAKWRRRKIKKAGLLKRWEMGRVLRMFLKLIRYGRRRGVEYRSCLAPLEYAELMAVAVPRQQSSLSEAMTIFEEALYSPQRLSRQKTGRYFALVRAIVKGKS